MKIQQNIGIINAMVRITCGLTMLTYITAKMVRRPYKQMYIFGAMAAAMKVAEGIVRYCPMTAMFKQGQDMYSNTVDTIKDAVSSFSDEMTMDDETIDQSYNPS